MSASHDCRAFRERLIEALDGGVADASAVPSPLSTLGWHEHLLACASCRELLEREEALELLLETQPEPVLPPDLARRVVRVLRAKRTESEPAAHAGGLEDLLDLHDVQPPARLSSDILVSLASERLRRMDSAPAAGAASDPDADLERLLELETVDVPEDLARTVLVGLRHEREAARHVGGGGQRHVWRAVAAAALVAFTFFGLWLLRERRVDEPGAKPIASTGGGQDSAHAPDLPADELLASLDLLENWELIEVLGEDLDVVASIDDSDLELLSWDGSLVDTGDELDSGEERLDGEEEAR